MVWIVFKDGRVKRRLLIIFSMYLKISFFLQMNIYFSRKFIGVRVESSEKFIEQATLPEIKTFTGKTNASWEKIPARQLNSRTQEINETTFPRIIFCLTLTQMNSWEIRHLNTSRGSILIILDVIITDLSKLNWFAALYLTPFHRNIECHPQTECVRRRKWPEQSSQLKQFAHTCLWSENATMR